MTIKRIHIYDIDETLVNSSHRYRNKPCGSIDLDYWIKHSTPEKLALDSLLPLADQYKADLSDKHTYVVIATARPCAAHDYNYIRERLGTPQHMISRPIGDSRPDVVLKVLGLRKLLSLKQFSGIAGKFWDDNPLNIAAVSDSFPHIEAIQV